MLRLQACLFLVVVVGIACRSDEPATRNTDGANASRASTPAAATSPAANTLVAGDPVPAAVLAGARHWQRSGAAGNRILLVTFGSTRCRDDSTCAQAQNKLRSLQHELQKVPTLKSSIGLLTMSVDPSHDMPAVLRAHADRVGADADLWRFAALPANRVDNVLAQFGASREDGATAIVDAEGKLVKIYAAPDWTVDEVARDLQSLVLRAEPTVLSAYIAAQEALAADNVPAARRALARLRTAVGEPAVSRLASAAADAKDLAAIRTAFKPLSEALVRLPWPAEYQPMYCPMFDGNAGATWVQKAGPVTNPYYGTAMLRCGTDLSAGAHEDHSPKFGGILFMAVDAFHHVEATYTADGNFRVRVYDNFRRQMTVTRFAAYVDVAAKPPVRLMPAADRMTLDARVGALPFPAEITLRMVLDPRGPEERFDFVFPSYSPDTD